MIISEFAKYLQEHNGNDAIYHIESDYWESILNFLYYANKNFEKAFKLSRESEITTYIKDNNGFYIDIKLGPMWDPKFMTKKGYNKYFKASNYKIFKI